MSNIPQCSIILPVRCRTTFTTNALASLIANGVRKDHQIILVLDKTSLLYELEERPDGQPRQIKYSPDMLPNILKEDKEGMNRVDNWVKSHRHLFEKYGIEIVIAKGDKEAWLDHRRIALVVEEGRKYVKHDWIIGYADEDLIFQKNWDQICWSHLSNRDPMKYCVVPSLSTLYYMNPEPDISFAWLENYIKDHKDGWWMDIPMPVSDPQISERKYRLPHSKCENYIQKVSLPGQVWTERCGTRVCGASNPFFVSTELVDSVGGWSLEGPYSHCYALDARFDYMLYTKEVTKIIPRDYFAIHTKSQLFINDEIEHTFTCISKCPISGSVTPGFL